MSALRTAAAWTAGLFVFLGMVVVLFTFPLLMPRRRWEGTLKALSRALVRCFGYHVRLRGLERLPPPGAMILVCNHVNFLDGFLLFGFLPLSFRALEQLKHFSWPIYGALTRRFGNIALDQSGGGKTAGALRSAEEALRSGIPLLIFPEGHRTRDGGFREFKRGAFRLAERAAVPVVPMVQRGAWEVIHKGSRRVRPGPVELEILVPWTAEDRSGLRSEEFRDRLRADMEEAFGGVSGSR